MKSYQVRVLHQGQVRQETRLASSEAVLRQQSAIEGEQILSVRKRWQWRTEALDWLVMVEQLLFLLQAGLNITETLATLARKEKHALPRLVLTRLLQQVEDGRRLSEGLHAVDPDIDYLLLSTVASNEDSGTLTDALARYLKHAQQMRETRRQLIGVLIYPIILLCAGLLIFSFLLLYVIPRFAHIFDSMTGELPAMSQLLLTVGVFAEAHRLPLLALLIGVPALFAGVIASPLLRQRLWRWSQTLPWLTARLQPLALARLYHMLALLTQNGMPLHRTLQGLAAHYQDGMRAPLLVTVQQLEAGVALSDALHTAGLTDAVIDSLLRAGERSGNIGACFASISGLLDAQNTDAIRRFGKVFEPALMLALGLGIGVVVVLMYMPIFELASSLQ